MLHTVFVIIFVLQTLSAASVVLFSYVNYHALIDTIEPIRSDWYTDIVQISCTKYSI